VIDWTWLAIGAVGGGVIVHVAHEWIWSSTARRITRAVMREIAEGQSPACPAGQ
jgi:hypothetical protein